MAKERILITVKTYPTLSSTYDETVCTAGLREDGSWIRIYPIPFRKLDEFEQYKKFDWIEVDVERNLKDPRNESHNKRSSICRLNHLEAGPDWRARNEVVLEKGEVYSSFEEVIAKNKNNREISLATFRPTSIIDLEIEEEKNRSWDESKLRTLELKSRQEDLFDNNADCFRVVRKVPYKFRYKFTEENGKQRKLLITDWEIGQLYWKCLKRRNGHEKQALEDVKNMYLNKLIKDRDIHFFVGTTHEWDLKNAPNPFTIIGVYSPPLVKQRPLF